MTDPNTYNETSRVNDPSAVPSTEERVKQSILKAMQFGQELIAEFGAQNVLSGKSTSEIAGLATALAPLQALLLSGSLYTAKEWIQSPAAASVPEVTKAHFLGRIDQYLAG